MRFWSDFKEAFVLAYRQQRAKRILTKTLKRYGFAQRKDGTWYSPEIETAMANALEHTRERFGSDRRFN